MTGSKILRLISQSQAIKKQPKPWRRWHLFDLLLEEIWILDRGEIPPVGYRVQRPWGTDNVTVNSLVGTDVAEVNIDPAATLGGGRGDAQADSVFVNGTAGADTF